MKVYYMIMDAEGSGCITAKGVIEADTKELLLKKLLAVQFSGEMNLQEVKDLYDIHMLHDKSFDEVLSELVRLYDEGDDQIERLCLTDVADDPADWFENVRRVFDGEVGTDAEEVTETQTTLLIKLS